MRIIPNNTLTVSCICGDFQEDVYLPSDTVEISDEEIDELYRNFVGVVNKPFSQKLREFVESRKIV